MDDITKTEAHNQECVLPGNFSLVLAELPFSSLPPVTEFHQVTSEGHRFELKFMEDCVQILSDEAAVVDDILEQVLDSLDLDSDWLTWINPQLNMVAHEIWRQDDNGNVLIRVTRCRADATRMIRRLESVPHKQMYWIRQVIGL